MPLVLVVDDDPKIVEAVGKTVTLADGFRVESVSKPAQALAAAVKLKPDIIILDIRLPGGDGRHILKSLKSHAATLSIPVIFLTGMGSEGDRVLGLDLGADDYVVKPFSAMELLARIRSVLRRTRPGGASGEALELSGLRIDPSTREASLDGRPLELRPREFELLTLLISHPGRALPRHFLIESTSTYGLPLETRSLDTHIKNLRKRLGSKAWLIETVHKFGYRLRPDKDV
ncbi:MAG: response regulator transcription factor [Elusimicrobiota bacterium]